MGRDVGKGAGRGVDGTRGRRVDAKGEGGGGGAQGRGCGAAGEEEGKQTPPLTFGVREGVASAA